MLENLSLSQAYDSGSNNLFEENFWSDWVEPNSNGDKFVDEPYSVDGYSNNKDPQPLTDPLRRVTDPHFLIKPIVVYPNGDETLNGTVVVRWLPAYDSKYHGITYSLYYSSDRGVTWNLIHDIIFNTSYTWNIATLPKSDTYKVKVVATDGKGISKSDVSDRSFSIIPLNQSTINVVQTPSFTITIIFAAFIFVYKFWSRRYQRAKS